MARLLEAEQRAVEAALAAAGPAGVTTFVATCETLLGQAVGTVVGGSIVRRAFARVGRSPGTLTPSEAPAFLEEVLTSASAFLSGEEAEALARRLIGETGPRRCDALSGGTP